MKDLEKDMGLDVCVKYEILDDRIFLKLEIEGEEIFYDTPPIEKFFPFIGIYTE